LWAYSKPVLYKLAYGTDREVPGENESPERLPASTGTSELEHLRQRIAQLESKLGGAEASSAVSASATTSTGS